jgi:hypothetical protein
MGATESPLVVLIVAFRHETAARCPHWGRSGSRCPQGSLLAYAIRIFIPHHTTASAITMDVVVKAFSKADEAIAMLSFAYPDEISM